MHGNKNINKIRRQMTKYEKLFATDKGLYPQYIKERRQKRRRPDILIAKWGENINSLQRKK